MSEMKEVCIGMRCPNRGRHFVEDHSAKFGEKWNEATWMFEASWYTDDELVLEMPFSGKTTRFNVEEARAMRDALNKFLGEK